ncbi:ATP-binding cassette domain-containing protein [Psychromonas aquimarina]|uniref:ATP-binding cassette domain-containing protein n=1 Tax=Psychromonas aquimarina TaxID=444919 RepID=UPI000414A7D0|nr:ATP-binding cassette domain-containing protein [Psychromonas aquimarina]
MSLVVKNLSVINKDQSVLFAPVSFSIDPGEILTLMGPSGCGKSTLLSAVAGHLSADFKYKGQCYLHGQALNHLSPEKRKIGILFQDDLLFPHLNIWENLALAIPEQIKKSQRKELAMLTLEKLNLEFIACSSPAQISGGQRARVSMMRMLLAEPDAVLLDEPFNKLDKSLRAEFRSWVLALLNERKLPALMVTHDQEDLPDNGRSLIWPWRDIENNNKESEHA